MRTKLFLLGSSLLTVGLVGCNWTEFDDLEGDTWISVQGQPNDDSTDFGVALARGARDTSAGGGGSIAVLGSGQAQYMRLEYSGTGSVEVRSALELNAQFGVGNLDLQPVLMADPASDEVSLVATTGGDQVTVLHGNENLVDRQIFGPRQAFAATYMIAPRSDMPGMVTPSFPLVAAGPDETISALYPGPFAPFVYPNPPPKCNVKNDDGTAVNIRGVGAAFVTSTTYHDIVVWSAEGALLVYDGNIFEAQNGSSCPGTANEGNQLPLVGKPAVSTGFQPGRGSQIIMYQDRYAILVGHKGLTNPESYLAVWDIGGATGSPVQIGATIAVPNLRSAAILENGTDRYVVAGYPNDLVDGTKSGRVQVYPFSLTDGLNAESVLTLHDASPESEQQFGRALAVTEFNGTPVIAVAADNEVFFYFRTALYGETREGK
jgi:hypothetical protein